MQKEVILSFLKLSTKLELFNNFFFPLYLIKLKSYYYNGYYKLFFCQYKKVYNCFLYFKNSYCWLLKKRQIITPITLIKNFLNGINCPYYTKINVIGLGFKLRYRKKINQLQFDCGYNHFIFLSLPDTLRARKIKKRRYLIYSLNLKHLRDLVLVLIKLKAMTLYKLRGLQVITFNLKFKIGKKQ